MKKAVVKSRREIYHGKSFSFTKEQATLPNGGDAEMACVRHPGSTAIVPLLADQTVILTRQYRYAIDEYLLEVPAGTMEPGESPRICAKRELEEETGMTARDFTALSHIHILPSYSDERIHVYLARGLRPSRQNLDEDEIIQVVRYPLKRVMEMVARGDITCALTILALYRTCCFLEDK